MSGRKTAIFTFAAIIVASGISISGAQAVTPAGTATRPAKAVNPLLPRLLQKGYEELRKGKYDDAVKTMADAVRLDPDSVSARRYLAFALMRKGASQDAIFQLITVSRMTKATPFDNYTLGEAYSRLGKLTEAENYYRAVLRTNPNYDPARASLIKTLSSTGKYQEAFTECLTGYRNAKSEMLTKYYRILYQNVNEQKLALHRVQDSINAQEQAQGLAPAVAPTTAQPAQPVQRAVARTETRTQTTQTTQTKTVEQAPEKTTEQSAEQTADQTPAVTPPVDSRSGQSHANRTYR